MKPQELCLVQEDGAGAKYMDIFDDLPPSVRERLRSTERNFCLACICGMAGYNEQRLHLTIDSFERGDFDDRRRREEIQRRDREFNQKRLRGFYREADRPFAYLDDSRRGPYGGFYDGSEGVLRERLPLRPSSYGDNIPAKNVYYATEIDRNGVRKPVYRQLEYRGKKDWRR